MRAGLCRRHHPPTPRSSRPPLSCRSCSRRPRARARARQHPRALNPLLAPPLATASASGPVLPGGRRPRRTTTSTCLSSSSCSRATSRSSRSPSPCSPRRRDARSFVLVLSLLSSLSGRLAPRARLTEGRPSRVCARVVTVECSCSRALRAVCVRACRCQQRSPLPQSVVRRWQRRHCRANPSPRRLPACP